MTDQFKNVKRDEEYADQWVGNPNLLNNKAMPKKKSPSGIQMAIAELEALSADSFKEGRLVAHYTFNTAIGVVKKYVKG